MQHENTVDKGDFQTVKARSCFIYSMSDEKENAPNTSVELFSVSWMKCIKVGCEGFFSKKGGKIFSHLSQICLPKTLGQKVVEIERNGVPSKQSLPLSFVKLINKIHKDVSHYWVFLWAGGRKGGTTDFWQHPTCFQTADFFFCFYPRREVLSLSFPKKKKKASQLGCVFKALSLNDSRKPAECFWCARRWPNCLFLGD